MQKHVILNSSSVLPHNQLARVSARWDRVRGPMTEYLSTPWSSLLIAAAIYITFTWIRLAANGFDPSSFVWAGDIFCDPLLVPSSLHAQKDYLGYDGQFFYRLALDPLTAEKTDFGITLDLPAYRAQRTVYPLIAWILSFGGRPSMVPTVMILVNVLALCGIGWAAAASAQTMQRHAHSGESWQLCIRVSSDLCRSTFPKSSSASWYSPASCS
jgi:hypothetical protein